MATHLDTPLPQLWEMLVADLEALDYPFDELNQTPQEYLAGVLTDMTAAPWSHLDHSFLELVEEVQHQLADPDLSRSTSTLGELLASAAEGTEVGPGPGPSGNGRYFGPNYFGPNYFGRYFGTTP